MLVSMVIVGVLASIAIVNFSLFSTSAYDKSALSDYRNVKVSFIDAFSQTNAPLRFVVRRQSGPGPLPSPLQSMMVSPDVEISVVYNKRIRRNRPPRITSTIEVRHLDGTKLYRRTDRNNIVTEQVVDL